MAQSMPARPSSHTQAKAPLPNSTHVPPLAHSFSPYVGQRMETITASARAAAIAQKRTPATTPNFTMTTRCPFSRCPILPEALLEAYDHFAAKKRRRSPKRPRLRGRWTIASPGSGRRHRHARRAPSQAFR
jgi:hypothetical protein